MLNKADSESLKSCLTQNNCDLNKMDNFSKEVFNKNIGLDKNEIKIIKNYKISLLSGRKT
jgi:hypothetical protein